jgi:hypothetical protein
MQNPKIRVDPNKIKNLLDDEHYRYILDCHIKYRRERLSFFFQNALDKNVGEWTQMPSSNNDGHYQMALSNDVNTIVNQEVFLINTANDERFTRETIKLLLDQLGSFITNLKGIKIRSNVNCRKV